MTANDRLAEIKANLPRQTYPTDVLSRRERNARDMLAALEAVLDLHDSEWDCEDPYGHSVTPCPACHPWCDTCQDDYPCPTVETINEALGVDQ